MSNTIYNKITINNDTLIDLSQDTVTSAAHIVSGHVGHLADGTQVTGTASGEATLQSKTVSPTESSQTVTPDSGYDGLSSVSVNAISSSYVGTGVTRRSSSDLTASGATVTAPAGYYAEAASKAVASGTAGTPTATKGTVSNHSVSITPSVTNTAGYISGGTKTGTAVSVSASELVSGDKEITSNGSNIDVTDYATVTVNVPTGGGDIGGLAYMVDVSSYDYAFAYMLMCMKKGDTKGGTVTYASAFPNTETKILETGLTTIHGIVFSRHDVSIRTNVDSQTCKTIFIFLDSSGSLNVIGMYANAVARIYGQAQGTVQQATPLNGSIRFDGGDIYYKGRYNKNANYQMLKVNTEYEWLAW